MTYKVIQGFTALYRDGKLDGLYPFGTTLDDVGGDEGRLDEYPEGLCEIADAALVAEATKLGYIKEG